jgi:hypothetical protein
MLRDSFGGWLFNDDKWDAEFCDKWDKIAAEGVYNYSDKDVDMLIHEGDVVLDLGAWWGDFTAYAAKKKAIVYPFEPDNENVEMIKRMIEMNPGFERLINIQQYGVGAKAESVYYTDLGGGSAQGHFAATEQNRTEQNRTEQYYSYCFA